MKKYVFTVLAILLMTSVSAHSNTNSGDQGFKDCYERFGRKKHVKITLKYKTSPVGDVKKVDLISEETTGSNSKFNVCILNEFKKVKLRPDGDNVATVSRDFFPHRVE